MSARPVVRRAEAVGSFMHTISAGVAKRGRGRDAPQRCFCNSAPLVSFWQRPHSWAPLPEGLRRLSLGRLLSEGTASSPSPVRQAIATGATIER